jgi:type IV pilus assembly protein PilX
MTAHFCSCHRQSRQLGVVLFIALIALVALSLGALALYRSVDSATAISGNISARQQGVGATGRAVEEASIWLFEPGQLVENLYNDRPLDGYYATMTKYVSDGDMLNFDWTKAKAVSAAATPAGYQMSYAIHRLCPTAGKPSSCVNAIINSDSKSTGDKLEGGDQAPDSSQVSPYYRITVRALGPRNTESIVQVLVY